MPLNYQHPQFAFLLEPDSKLQNNFKPEMKIDVNGNPKQLKVVEENGKWFWALTDLETGENNIYIK